MILGHDKLNMQVHPHVGLISPSTQRSFYSWFPGCIRLCESRSDLSTNTIARRGHQMDPVFDAQYLTMKHLFSRDGTDIDVAYTPVGEVDHVHVAGRLLAVDRDDNVPRLQAAVPGLRRADPGEQPGIGDLVLLSTEGVEGGHLTATETLGFLEERLGGDNRARTGDEPLATLVHVMHTARLCAATEPGVPAGSPPQPWPAPRVAVAGQDRVRLGISDTGLWEEPDPARHPWLAGVEGEPDRPGPTLPGGLPSIPHHAGHGTFVAGVARSMAPGATVYVGNHFPTSGGELEHVVVSKLEDLIRDQSPDVIILAAGTYTRNNLAPLAFSDFRRRHPNITLVAAAGNDSTSRPFWPAAFDWTTSAGASEPTSSTVRGSAITATGWTCTRSAKAWSMLSPPACIPTRNRRNGQRSRPSTGWPAGTARHFPRHWSPGSSRPRWRVAVFPLKPRRRRCLRRPGSRKFPASARSCSRPSLRYGPGTTAAIRAPADAIVP